jgi:hypothetical protein
LAALGVAINVVTVYILRRRLDWAMIFVSLSKPERGELAFNVLLDELVDEYAGFCLPGPQS